MFVLKLARWYLNIPLNPVPDESSNEPSILVSFFENAYQKAASDLEYARQVLVASMEQAPSEDPEHPGESSNEPGQDSSEPGMAVRFFENALEVAKHDLEYAKQVLVDSFVAATAATPEEPDALPAPPSWWVTVADRWLYNDDDEDERGGRRRRRRRSAAPTALATPQAQYSARVDPGGYGRGAVDMRNGVFVVKSSSAWKLEKMQRQSPPVPSAPPEAETFPVESREPSSLHARGSDSEGVPDAAPLSTRTTGRSPPSTPATLAAPDKSAEAVTTTCAICQAPLDGTSSERTLPCGHHYHVGCVEGLASLGVDHACPACRPELPPGSPEQHFEEATRWYFEVQRRVERGDAAWGALGRAHAAIMHVVVESWRAAARQGHGGAQFNLGILHMHGHGVEQNYSEAVRCYRRAALLGNERPPSSVDPSAVGLGMV